MLDEEAVSKTTEASEVFAKEHLAQLGVEVQPLDRRGKQKRKRPEFVLVDPANGQAVALCEVKTLISAGYDRERDEHHSTLDPQTLDGGVRSFSVLPDSYRRALDNAVPKYRATVEDMPEYQGLPYLVALFSDLIPESFLLDQWVFGDEFPEISGLLRKVSNRELKAAAAAMSKAELDRRINTGDMTSLPPETVEWRLVVNPNANVPVPDRLSELCIR